MVYVCLGPCAVGVVSHCNKIVFLQFNGGSLNLPHLLLFLFIYLFFSVFIYLLIVVPWFMLV